MPFSKSMITAKIKTAAFAVRFAGWLRTGDARRYKPRAEMLKGRMLSDYFAEKYLPMIGGLRSGEIIAPSAPETIWQFWDNPAGRSTPDIVKACIDSVKRHKGDFDHKILDNDTIQNYSDLPGFIMDKFKNGRIGYAHFSDLLRLNLLKNHGGVWMDATCYMTDSVPRHITNKDFFIFLVGQRTAYPYSFMQNCFIRAKKSSYLCEAWYQLCIEYWKTEIKNIDYFQHQLMFRALVENNLTAKKLFAEMPRISEDETHLLTGDKLTGKFDAAEWERITRASFFQKTTFKITAGIDLSGTYFETLSKGGI